MEVSYRECSGCWEKWDTSLFVCLEGHPVSCKSHTNMLKCTTHHQLNDVLFKGWYILAEVWDLLWTWMAVLDLCAWNKVTFLTYRIRFQSVRKVKHFVHWLWYLHGWFVYCYHHCRILSRISIEYTYNVLCFLCVKDYISGLLFEPFNDRVLG